MDNLLNILNLFNSPQKQEEPQLESQIPKEILDQYPYGKFPERYTKSGQENLRKNSEGRFANIEPNNNNESSKEENNNLDISSFLPVIQLISGKQQPKDMMKILSKLLFKDNKNIEKFLDIMSPKNKVQEIKINTPFPDTNKIKISSLRRIDE